MTVKSCNDIAESYEGNGNACCTSDSTAAADYYLVASYHYFLGYSDSKSYAAADRTFGNFLDIYARASNDPALEALSKIPRLGWFRKTNALFNDECRAVFGEMAPWLESYGQKFSRFASEVQERHKYDPQKVTELLAGYRNEHLAPAISERVMKNKLNPTVARLFFLYLTVFGNPKESIKGFGDCFPLCALDAVRTYNRPY